MFTNPFTTLDQLPRVELAHLPTPIESLLNLSAYLGGPEIFIKRDDQTGLATGGNKARKLEFLIAQALSHEADCVITAGSTQSNHARQTAAAAARYGLACHLVLYAPNGEPPTDLRGNLLLDRILGATIHWTDERAPYSVTIAQVEAELRDAGHYPFIIPYGGSNPFGVMGYAVAMREFAAQARGLPKFDTHVFGSSSGGTQAGMVLGAYLTRLTEPTITTDILGISIDSPAAELAPRVTRLAMAAASELDLEADDLEQSLAALVEINDDYLGGGYAVVGDAERAAIRLLAQHEGILIDPVYTGRAFAGLIDLIRRGVFTRGQRVLFWHTGGSAALFAFADALSLEDES
ncbi:MAG: D-cysteine desulfhydrase family protein [Anaerolineae bacterium]|nr:D-cysteine desulfhydrase family protein [Anaerolineae bacterium]